MKKTQLVMVVHNHLPIDQNDSVLEQAADRCYEPFLQTLERHPAVRLGLHYSGILFEWMENHRSALIDRLSDLCGRGQVELLGGGFYEPILSALPRSDAIGQIEMMNEYIQKRIGIKPEGIWLAEQVWEPELIDILARSQLRFTLLDDNHFFRAGRKPGRLFGYHVTEKDGVPLAVFSMDASLRNSIPQKTVNEVIEELSKEASTEPRGMVYGDDGHRLGYWPGSYERVFENGWLEEFFQALEHNDCIECVSPLAYINRFPPAGRIYLPSGASEKMLIRSIPTETLQHIDVLKQELKRAGLADNAGSFISCGSWQSFLSKYTEANHLHKKMLLVSSKLSDTTAEQPRRVQQLDQARHALYRSQSHDVYWHGPSGGLHLPRLREMAYRELIRAESVLDTITQTEGEDWISYDERDFDADLTEEVIAENAWINVYIDPAEGGVITEVDYKPQTICPTNVLTRRTESYHRFLQENPGDQDESEHNQPDQKPSCLQDDSVSKNPGLLEKMVADKHPRRCFLDRFPAAGTSLEELQQATYLEEGDFLGARYHVEMAAINENNDCEFEIMMSRTGHLLRGGKKIPLVLEKHIKVPLDRAEIQVAYNLRNPEATPVELVFCPELNLSLHSEDDSRCIFELDQGLGLGPSLQTSGETEEAPWLALVDPSQHLRIGLQWDPPATVWRHPVETVSLTECGIRSVFQGTAIIPKWEITIPPNQSFNVKICWEFRPVEKDDDAVVPLPEANQPTET